MDDRMPSRINFLYSNIGRGHPFYLDGILESLIRRGSISLVKGQTDVFEVSRGLSRRSWQAARWLYREGSSGGALGHLYARLRQAGDYNRGGLGMHIMGRDIRRVYSADSAPILVDHPLLVGILRGRGDLLYQHGEQVAPREAIVAGASMIFVPSEEVARAFLHAGYSEEQLFISGLCIEPTLARQAEGSFQSRMTRLESRTPLTGAMYSSGAEPPAHIAAICNACLSVVQEGGRAVVFAREDGKLLTRLSGVLRAQGLEDFSIRSTDFLPQVLPPILIAIFNSPREETALTSRLFPAFDYFVAPSHERTNWALGLGLPMFVLTPTIGEFARLNLDLLRNAAVGEALSENLPPATLGVALRHYRREGQLRRMAEAGWGRRRIDGFPAIADFLVNRYA